MQRHSTLPFNLLYKRLFALFFTTFFLGYPVNAQAGSALRWFGNDSRSAAMGGGGVALGSGPTTLEVNPALMAWTRTGAWVSWMVVPNNLSIEAMAKPANFDVPNIMSKTDPGHWPSQMPLASEKLRGKPRSAENLSTLYFLNLAAITTVGHPSVKVGLGLSLPLDSLFRLDTWYNDEREQFFSNRLHFERFGEFDRIISIYPAVAYSPLPWLSVGLALKIEMAMGLGAQLYVSDVEQMDSAAVATAGDVSPTLRPSFALAFQLPWGLRGGIAYRHMGMMKVDINVDLQIANLEKIFKPSYSLVLGWEPSELSWGIGYERQGLAIEAQATYEHWSNYQDRHANHRVPPWGPEPGFANIVSLSTGAEWKLKDFIALRAGFGFHPSAAPEQTGRFNHVDSDLLLYSLGIGLEMHKWQRLFTCSLSGQLWQMIPLSVNKIIPGQSDANAQGDLIIDEVPDNVTDAKSGSTIPEAAGLQTNNPGFPGYTVGGTLMVIAVMLGMEF